MSLIQREQIRLGIKKPPTQRGVIWSEERRLWWSEKQKGKKGHPHSLETRLQMREARLGSKSYNWKGGLTSEAERIRKSLPYRLWRKAVFERDDYTCQDCGKRGGKLNADHIKPFALFPELRFNVSNGRTLCSVPCHRRTETYGGRVSRLKL